MYPVSGCILSFGIVTFAQGFGTKFQHTDIISAKPSTVQNYSGILATRFFLGLTEAGIFPGSVHHGSPSFPVHLKILEIPNSRSQAFTS
jgi:hypothetical protein